MKLRENVKVKVKGFFVRSRIWADTRGFGMNEVLGIAAALIIAGVVIIPGFKGLASSMISGLTKWWDDIAKVVFTIT